MRGAQQLHQRPKIENYALQHLVWVTPFAVCYNRKKKGEGGSGHLGNMSVHM